MNKLFIIEFSSIKSHVYKHCLRIITRNTVMHSCTHHATPTYSNLGGELD